MTTRVFLIRHGDTANAHADRFTGKKDVPLTDEGKAHADELATRLATFDIKAVYSSTMQRAHETAQAIAKSHSLEVVPLKELCEVDHGHWDGLSIAEIQSRYPQDYAEWQRDPFRFKPLGGESPRSALERILPAFLKILRAHPNEQIVVVAHSGTNRLLISHFLRLDLRDYRDVIAQRPACVNVLDFNSETQVMLSLLNDVSHYIIGAPPHSPYVV